MASKHRVLVPIGTGFEEIETITILDVLRRADAEVVLASVLKKSSLVVEGNKGVKVVCDANISDCVHDSWDMITLPGGNGNAKMLS